MKKLGAALLVAVCALTLSACSSPEGDARGIAQRALENNGTGEGMCEGANPGSGEITNIELGEATDEGDYWVVEVVNADTQMGSASGRVKVDLDEGCALSASLTLS